MRAEPYQDGAPNPEMINFTIRNEQARDYSTRDLRHSTRALRHSTRDWRRTARKKQKKRKPKVSTFLCTAQISKFQEKSYYNVLPFFLILGSKFPEICHFSAKSSWKFAGISQKFSENADCRQYLIKFAKIFKKSGNFRNPKMDEKCSFVHFIVSIVSLTLTQS